VLTILDKHNTGHRARELPALGGHLHGIDCVASVEIFACGLFRRWGGEEGLRKLRLPALRQGLHIMPALGERRGAAVRLHDIVGRGQQRAKQRSQHHVRAPRRSLLRLLWRPMRRCRQRQEVLETSGFAWLAAPWTPVAGVGPELSGFAWLAVPCTPVAGVTPELSITPFFLYSLGLLVNPMTA
jgi:hypothetical protein